LKLLKVVKSFSRLNYLVSDQLAKHVVKFESEVNTVQFCSAVYTVRHNV